MEFYNYGRDLAVKNELITANMGMDREEQFLLYRGFPATFRADTGLVSDDGIIGDKRGNC